ncbi:MAG TPA: SDR family NAD(P)-dependent oxidoreductase [Myxococcales bacterium]|jgi:dehydrogenase/reductase SDR family protein 1
MHSLRGKVAIVTGASRGIGKGIARELGRAGATVVVTGRSVEPGSHRLGGTVGETARLVDEAGGRGLARQVDHGDDEQVRRLVRGVFDELGHIDLLVNNVFAVPEPGQPGAEAVWGPFWQAPLWAWDSMHRIGLRSHYVASCLVAPHMVAARSGLIVNISSWGGKAFFGSVAYCVGKTGVDRLAEAMSHDLREHAVAALSLYPGTVRTERMLEAAKDHPEFDLKGTESPELTGRAVVALASDPRILERTGTVQVVARLAREYGFTEDDGSLPPLQEPAGA